jgi:glycosyltransferase involved in cell wall biosynthesis
MWAVLRERIREADIVHVNSLWMFPNIVPGLVTRPDQGAKLVVSPHGTLSPWAMNMSKCKKRVAWWLLGQRLTLKRAACFHATAESEYEDIRRLGFRQPVAIIPNGIDIPAPPLGGPRRGERRTLLFLGRVHRIKGVDLLLNAWGRLAARYPDWDLAIVGPSDPPGYHDEMQALATRLGLARVSFVGPLYGSAKSEAYWNADVFVLPTHSENFGMAVAEALAHACPAITTRGAPWAGLETERCGWWIEDSLAALTAALDHAMSLDRGALAEMGARGRAWMERDFGWDGIAQRMAGVYSWLLGRGETPACVVVN